MFAEHEETTIIVQASAREVFDWLDDPTRLARHMTVRSWKMGWGKMDVQVDEGLGRRVGSHINLRGRVFGILVYLDETVIQHEPPNRKYWEAVGEPRLLVMGPYRMGFELAPVGAATTLRVAISYRLPRGAVQRILGRLFGRSYAKWCVKRMADDAHRAFAHPIPQAHSTSTTTHINGTRQD